MNAEPRKRPRPRKSQGLTATHGWKLAGAAQENAARLLAAARVLKEAGHFGPALSIAIMAREELGKVFLAILVGAGIAKPGTLRGREHQRKQAAGVIVSRMGPMTGFAKPVLAEVSTLRGVSAEDSVAQLVEKLVPAVKKMELDAAAANDANREAERALAGAHEALRQSGLYVDLKETDGVWRVTTPSDISEEAAAKEISITEAFFEVNREWTSAFRVDPEIAQSNSVSEEQMIDSLAELARRLFTI